LEIPLQQRVKEAFISHFGASPQVMSRAPGRINIIGEHIDYNDGFVLPVAIDRYIVAAMASNHSSSLCRVHALDTAETAQWTFDKPSYDRPPWLAYIYGTIMEWHQKGLSRGGVDILFAGEIPMGAGLSSSAALEASVATGLASLWSVIIGKREMALHCQRVEQQYAGVNCGIMDQYASIFGKPGQAIFLDCQTISHEYVPLALGDYHFLLINSGVSHSLASSQYNLRRESCEEAMRILRSHFPFIHDWRAVRLEQLEVLRESDIPLIYKRALHVVREIARVKQARDALIKNDLLQLGSLMYQSHRDLSDNYEVSCAEMDFLVEQAKHEPAVLGARMMGGGFGGCTLNLIRKDTIGGFVEKIQHQYGHQYGIKPECYLVDSGMGAGLIPADP
jgi:galactokinase